MFDIQKLAIQAGVALLALIAIFSYGYYKGSSNVQDKWEKEKLLVNNQVQAQLIEANRKVIEIERQYASKSAAVAEAHAKNVRKLEDEKNNALMRARNGGLFINAKCSGFGIALPPIAAASAGTDGATRVELSKTDGEFLVRFAAEADSVAERLTACQALLKSEREPH